MSSLRQIVRRVRRRVSALVARPLEERRLDDELRLHIALEAEQLEREGLPADEARRRAVAAFGGVERFKDEARDVRGVSVFEDIGRDLRYAARTLARSPAITAAAILTLAIGVGGTTAIYGAVHHILLSPLPYPEADRIVTVWQHDREAGTRGEAAPGNFLDWRERARSFTRLAASEPFGFDWAGPEGAESFETALVTEGFFEVLGVPPLLGRTFAAEEHEPGGAAVVVLSHELWRRRFAEDPSVVGRVLVLDSLPRTVVGVMPPRVDLPYGEDVWAPKVSDPDEREARTSAYWTVVGRLRPGVTVESARAEMRDIGLALAREHPRANADVGVEIVPLEEQVLGRIRGALLVLLGAVGCVLLIACANVANLQIARATRRAREFGVRVALGAGRERLLRQLATENVLLAVLGGAAGLALAMVGVRAIRALAPADLPRIDELQVDAPVLLFGAALALGTSMLFGLAPMLHVVRHDVRDALSGEGRASTAGAGRRTVRGVLVVGEVALALVLLVGAGLLVRSFDSLLRVERGFESDGVAVVTVQAWGYYPTREQRAAFVRDATARLAALPGVVAAGTTSSLPLASPIGAERATIDVEGQATPTEQRPTVHVSAVTPGYFDALRIPLREGRGLLATDDAGSAPVVLVSETLARRLWPGQSALGRRITFGFQGRPVARDVVGVVGDVRHDGLHEAPRASVFIPHAQGPSGAVQFVVRGAGDAAALLPAMKREIQTMNAAMPVSDPTTLDALVDGSLRERRFHLALLGAFAAVALLLATVGIYGVMSQVADERVREMAIRIALGARPGEVVGRTVAAGGTLAALGLAIGAAAAVGVTGVLERMLFGVTPLDAAAYTAAAVVLLGAALLACWLPARRAGRVDLVRSLRGES